MRIRLPATKPVIHESSVKRTDPGLQQSLLSDPDADFQKQSPTIVGTNLDVVSTKIRIFACNSLRQNGTSCTLLAESFENLPKPHDSNLQPDSRFALNPNSLRQRAIYLAITTQMSAFLMARKR